MTSTQIKTVTHLSPKPNFKGGAQTAVALEFDVDAHREAGPIFSASTATRRIVSGEAIVPYCRRAIPTATFESSDRPMELGTWLYDCLNFNLRASRRWAGLSLSLGT